MGRRAYREEGRGDKEKGRGKGHRIKRRGDEGKLKENACEYLQERRERRE